MWYIIGYLLGFGVAFYISARANSDYDQGYDEHKRTSTILWTVIWPFTLSLSFCGMMFMGIFYIIEKFWTQILNFHRFLGKKKV